MMPRSEWPGARKPAAIDRARKKVNREKRDFCRVEAVGRITHPEYSMRV